MVSFVNYSSHFFFNCLLLSCYGYYGNSTTHKTITRLHVPTSKLRPYESRYIRVELPYLFSSALITIKSDVNLAKMAKTSFVPMICFRHGGPPLPDASDFASSAFDINEIEVSSGETYYLKNIKKCYSLQKNMTFIITDGQIRSSVYYIGFFNGVRSTRFRQKKIITGASFSITIDISVEACSNSSSYCNPMVQCSNGKAGRNGKFVTYCLCDKNQGKFGFSVDLVSEEYHNLTRSITRSRHEHAKHRLREIPRKPTEEVPGWQSICVIASNVAAMLPAFWAHSQKAYSEWVIFMASGIFSALYHACDENYLCSLKFSVLQFMDFWLSFVAGVSIFIYLIPLSEATKRVIQTFVLIATAVLTITNATRPVNVVIVTALGFFAILVGWLIEVSDKHKSVSSPIYWRLSSSQNVFKIMLVDLADGVRKRCPWRFVYLGFVTLVIAATSWYMESSRSYQIWHSVWHVTVYVSGFFFLRSKVVDTDGASVIPNEDMFHLEGED